MWPMQFPNKRKGPTHLGSSVACPIEQISVVEKPHLLGVNRQICNQPRGLTRVSTQSLFHLLLSHVLQKLASPVRQVFLSETHGPPQMRDGIVPIGM